MKKKFTVIIICSFTSNKFLKQSVKGRAEINVSTLWDNMKSDSKQRKKRKHESKNKW
jgi:hypothetical protein